MNHKSIILIALTMSFSLFALINRSYGNSFGGTASCGTITLNHCLVKPAKGKNTAAYGLLIQNSDEGDVLLNASSPYAEKVEIHDMTMENNIMKMYHLKDGIKIPSQQAVIFQPGGKHLMLIGVKSDFSDQTKIPITLNFKEAGSIEVNFKVEPEVAKKFEEAGLNKK